MANIGGTLMENNNRYYPNAYYKVGDLFFTTNKENPSIRFGGSWELFGKGKTLVCVDENDSDFNEVKKSGGEKTHKLTIEEMPAHNHDMDDATYGGYKNKLGIRGDGGGGSQLIPQMTQTNGFSRYIPDSRGGSQSHNNVQPYITCYIWIRVK